MSGFTGVGCSVVGTAGKKLSLLSFICFGVVGISPVDYIEKRKDGEKIWPTEIIHVTLLNENCKYCGLLHNAKKKKKVSLMRIYINHNNKI